MEPLIRVKTNKTPVVNFNNLTGKFVMGGRSTPEDSIDFYKPLVDWLIEYIKNPHPSTEVNIHFEYFNTGSSKCITDVFKELEAIYKAGNKLVVNWYYDDEYILDAGEDYKSFIRVPFNLIEVKDE
ncbi:MAG: DUF1987 domain-containing protein [Bacteroidia bacterium]|nr:DUF1987 domain-containing protein [Bacteroidia bacterium]